MALSPYDQLVYDAGFKFIPQTSYLQNPFIIPQNNVEVGDSSTAGLPSIYIGGVGGGDNNPFNPNMNQIRTDFRPNTDFRQFQDFGNLTDGRDILFGSSSSTRGVMAGGRDPSNTNIIDYITIATTGNATDFCDLLSATYYYAATSNSTRAVWLGNQSLNNTTEYVTIATPGISVDWGDQGGTPQHAGGACSDSHGGIA